MILKPAVRIGKRYQNPIPTSVGGLSTMFKVLSLYISNKAERTPRTPIGPFRTDARIYRTPPASGLRVTWFGHSSSLIEIDGVRILVDPVWDFRAGPVGWAGPRRFFPPTLQLDQLSPTDVVLQSHDHYDHLGAKTVQQLSQMESFAKTQWLVPLGVGAVLNGFGVKMERIRELNWTESINIGSIQITALPARHFSGRSAFNRFHTLWASYVLAGPKHRVNYGADSGEWEGFAEIGRDYGPFDLSMLEIGAFDPLWADIHMGPDGAVRSFQALGGEGLFMPIHWGLFDLALHAWRQPIERIFSYEDMKLFSPEPGQPTEFIGREVRSDWWR